MSKQAYLLLLVAGLTVLGSGFGLYLNGPSKAVVSESTVLYSGRIFVYANNWNYLGTPVDGIPLFANNTVLQVKVSSLSGRILICLMNESQFSDWKETQNKSSGIIAQTIDTSYNSSITPAIGEVYYYVFQNLDKEENSLEFTVTVEGDFLHFDYGPVYSYLAVLVIGVVTTLVAGWKLSGTFAHWHDKWEEPIVRTTQMKKDDAETDRITRYSAVFGRRILKYVVIIILVATIVTYFPVLQLIPSIVSEQSLRPEYTILFLDYILRTFIFRFFIYLPFLLIFVCSYLFLRPRLADLSRFAALRLHLTGPKQYAIGKELTSDLFRTITFKRFIGLSAMLGLPLIIGRFVFSLLNNYDWMIYLVAAMSILGIYLGFLMGLFLDRARSSLQIGKYALRHYFMGSSLSVVTLIVPMASIIYAGVFISDSSYYQSLLDRLFFLPVRLNQPFSFLAENTLQPDLPIVAAVMLVITFALILLFMFLIPFLYSMTTREIVSALIVLVVVEVTQQLVEWIFAGTMEGIFQPLSLLAPIVASTSAGALHNHYKKRVERTLKVEKGKSVGKESVASQSSSNRSV